MPPASPPGPNGGRNGSGHNSDLAVRIASSAVLVPIAIGTAWLGGWWFVALWLAAGLGLLWEWTHLVAPREAVLRIAVAGGAGLAGCVIAFASGHETAGLLLVIAAAGVAAAMAPSALRLWAAGGVIYAGALALAPAVLRLDPAFGFVAILLLFAVVWATDIAAYFGGRLVGGPRLWPRVSPNKTWSGALSGLAAAVLAGVAIALTMGLGTGSGSILWLGALCMMLSVCAQAGDLFESAIKRRFGAKDSSKLIPGHGGLMDRLDGFVAAAVGAAIIGTLRGGLDDPARGLLIW